MTGVKLRDGSELVVTSSHIGDRLKSVRLAMRKTQEDMARALCVSHRSYQFYEVGQRHPPLSVVLDVIQSHDLDAEWFLFGEVGRDTSKKGADE